MPRKRPSELTEMGSVVCQTCGTTYPADVAEMFFRRGWSSRIRDERRRVCIGCEQTLRDERKRLCRAKTKAHDTIANHANKYGMRKADFARKYGWDADRIAHDVEHAYENTCNYCWRPYAEMEHGLADVTIDIVDPQKEPYYATNTKPCCRTCNTEKGPLNPEQWARKRIGWQLWQDHQTLIAEGLADLPGPVDRRGNPTLF
jgi:hypothetical protein